MTIPICLAGGGPGTDWFENAERALVELEVKKTNKRKATQLRIAKGGAD